MSVVCSSSIVSIYILIGGPKPITGYRKKTKSTDVCTFCTRYRVWINSHSTGKL